MKNIPSTIQTKFVIKHGIRRKAKCNKKQDLTDGINLIDEAK